MARWPKPAEGSWTEHYPELGTAPGVVRGLDLAGVLRARARGDLQARVAQRRAGGAAAAERQLLHQGARRSPARRSSSCAAWTARCGRSTTSAATAATSWCGTTSPAEEVNGTCRQFTCKYHGWRYDLDGSLNFVQQEGEFFDLDKDDFGLVPVHCDVWEGFIFVNLAQEPEQSLREFLGPMVTVARGLPVRPDDRALLVPHRGEGELEALHGRLPGVLPRTRSAREAVAGEVLRTRHRRRASRRRTTGSTVRTAS